MGEKKKKKRKKRSRGREGRATETIEGRARRRGRMVEIGGVSVSMYYVLRL